MPRNITSEFKHECAELVLAQGYKHKDAATAMGSVCHLFNGGLISIKKNNQELPQKQLL